MSQGRQKVVALHYNGMWRGGYLEFLKTRLFVKPNMLARAVFDREFHCGGHANDAEVT